MTADRPSVAVLDYGSGNVHSAVKALVAAGADVTLTRDRDDVANADGLVVPGVGAFGAVMDQLREVRGDEMIERRLAGGRPVLGICVGMQILFDRGVEHGLDTAGLGQWPGTVVQLDAPILPHMGWNTVDAAPDSVLFAGIETERFYFVHSYAATDWTLEAYGAFASRRAVHRRGRKRTVDRNPVSPREIRRGGAAAFAKLDPIALTESRYA